MKAWPAEPHDDRRDPQMQRHNSRTHNFWIIPPSFSYKLAARHAASRGRCGWPMASTQEQE